MTSIERLIATSPRPSGKGPWTRTAPRPPRAARRATPSPSGRGAGDEGQNLPSPSGRGAGGEGGVPSVADDLRHFAFDLLPGVLKRQTNNYTSMVSETADALHEIAGPRNALKFLVQRIEAEPDWLRLNNQDGWSQHCNTLGQWRTEVKDLGEVEKPLLAIVLKETPPRPRIAATAEPHAVCQALELLWGEKEADMARTAEEVWAQQKQSGAACQYVAEYLYSALDHYPRAIEILLDAHRREVLDDGGQSRLVEYLRGQNRFAETIPILEPWSTAPAAKSPRAGHATNSLALWERGWG